MTTYEDKEKVSDGSQDSQQDFNCFDDGNNDPIEFSEIDNPVWKQVKRCQKPN